MTTPLPRGSEHRSLRVGKCLVALHVRKFSLTMSSSGDSGNKPGGSEPLTGTYYRIKTSSSSVNQEFALSKKWPNKANDTASSMPMRVPQTAQIESNSWGGLARSLVPM